MKKFLSQIGIEIKNVLHHKFLLIIAILIFAGSVAFPIISLLATPKNVNNGGGPILYNISYEKRAVAVQANMVYGGNPGQESITVNGVTITSENPFYGQIRSAQEQKKNFTANKGQFTNPETLNMLLDAMDMETTFYLRCAQSVTRYEDYRTGFANIGLDKLYDKFFFEHADVKEDALLEMQNYRKGMDPEAFKLKYLKITPEERLAALDKTDEYLNKVYQVIEGDNFPLFIDLSIQQQNDSITDLNAQIAIQEKAIIDNPLQEENINQIIENLKNNIKQIQTDAIPILEYRLQKNIKPGEDIWQNRALDDISNCRGELLYTTIVSEDKFQNDPGLVQQYKTYTAYKDTIQKRINELNNTMLIAQKSLDADKPDMKYVNNGARNQTVQFLDFSVVIALFAIIVGGWIMASEFQQGTIRLLMIRPKTRIKILMSKFTGALLICLALYTAGCLLNLIANGICYGFTDLSYPNYTVSGGINFFAYYIPKFFACMVPIVFAFTVAFMLSVVSKNIAVSISVPIACFVLCTIAMYTIVNKGLQDWLAYTPVPYVQLSSFFILFTPVRSLMERGFPASLTIGISMLLVLSVIWTFISIVVFKKRDITN